MDEAEENLAGTIDPARDEAEGKVSVILEGPIQDGVTWIVFAQIPAWNAKLEVTVGGANQDAAMAEAQEYVQAHIGELHRSIEAARAKALAN